ncbi:(2Fe-2S)-binding protein [Actinopolymorpha pittospori]
MAEPSEARELLSAIAGIGPYFALTVESREESADPSLAQLYAGHPALRAHLARVAERLGTSELRVAGSIFFQGMAARLWSPVLAVALLDRRVLVLDAALTWPDLAAPGVPLRTAGASAADSGRSPDIAALAPEVADATVTAHLTPLLDAVRREVRLPDALLWGNAASALLGTLGVLARARPALAEPAAALAVALLGLPPLDGTGTLDPAGEDAPGRFVRSTCCLYYRVPGGGFCGDCALLPR